MIGAPSMHDIIHARSKLGERAGAQAIARFLGCSVIDVQRVIEPVAIAEDEGLKAGRSKAERERLFCNAWLRGDTIERIQDDLALTIDQVRYWRRRLGLPPRVSRTEAAA